MTDSNNFYIARTEWKKGTAVVTWLWPHYSSYDEAKRALSKLTSTDTTTYEIRKKETHGA